MILEYLIKPFWVDSNSKFFHIPASRVGINHQTFWGFIINKLVELGKNWWQKRIFRSFSHECEFFWESRSSDASVMTGLKRQCQERSEKWKSSWKNVFVLVLPIWLHFCLLYVKIRQCTKFHRKIFNNNRSLEEINYFANLKKSSPIEMVCRFLSNGTILKLLVWAIFPYSRW